MRKTHIIEPDISSLTTEQIEDLEVRFASCDPIHFCKFLGTLNIPDSTKGLLLRAKIDMKPNEQDQMMQGVIEGCMKKFWTRLETQTAGR